ncbi:MAG: glycosyltransferase, partial [Mesorhizobium sp.]
MAVTTPRVCVIIAARNAARTIPVAIASALREPEVAEVVVVDDASTDDTQNV